MAECSKQTVLDIENVHNNFLKEFIKERKLRIKNLNVLFYAV